MNRINNFPPIETSHIISEKELEDTIGGACDETCKACDSTCKACTPGNKNDNNGNSTTINTGHGSTTSGPGIYKP